MIALALVAGVCLLGMFSLVTAMALHILWYGPSSAEVLNGWVLIGSAIFWFAMFCWRANRDTRRD